MSRREQGPRMAPPPNPETPKKKELEKGESASRIVNGERLGIPSEAYAKYTKELKAIFPHAQPVDVIVGEWKPPHGKVPHDAQMYAALKRTEEGTAIHVIAHHPEELKDDDIAWLFGHVVPKGMGAIASYREDWQGLVTMYDVARREREQKALRGLFRERLSMRMRETLKQHIADPGVQRLCEAFLDSFPKVSFLAVEDAYDNPPVESVISLMYEMIDLLKNGTDEGKKKALGEKIADVESEWKILSDEEKLYARGVLARAVAFS